MSTPVILEAELERELRHLHDLVVVRDILRARHASADDLDICEVAIREERNFLADLARRSTEHHAAAA
jgi:hypothetical protein